MYLLDSDFIINLLKKDTKAKDILASLASQSDSPFTLSVISLAEIKEGLLATKSGNKLKSFEKLVQKMHILPIRIQTALVFAETRLGLRKKGKLIDNMDLLIAATCLEHNLTLVTFNAKHFKRIPRLKVFSS